MRPKVIIGVLLLAFVLMGVAALISNALRPRPAIASPGAPAPAEASAHAASAKDLPVTRLQPLLPAAPVAGKNSAAMTTNTAAAENRAPAADVARQISELNTLAMNDDAASRDAILAQMRNPDKAIRKAALEAAIQFGDRSVVPPLKEIAAQTEDSTEKADILAAIDYINLPSLTEVLAEQKAQMAAMGITNVPNGLPNRSQTGSGHRRGSSPAPGSPQSGP
jgi:hypothetical protein